MSRSLLFAVAAACACATAPRAVEESKHQTRIYVGHSGAGEVLVAASHADAMRGLAVPASELDVKNESDPDGGLLCRRELVTGTHVPQWTCRYVRETEEDRMRTQILLDRLPKNCMSAEYCVGD
jgi:hypothetical protein